MPHLRAYSAKAEYCIPLFRQLCQKAVAQGVPSKESTESQAMTKQTVICPHCSRDIGLVGKGANVKLMRHNYMARNPISGAYVSKYPCEKGSGLLVLPLLLREAEREHDHAKKRFKEAEEEIKKAEAELHRTAAEIDRLRAIK